MTESELKDFWPIFSEEELASVDFNITKEGTTKPNKVETSPVLFTDDEAVVLPYNYQKEIYCWMRPIEFFSEDTNNLEKKIIIAQTSGSTDLHKENEHLKDSSYYLQIIDAFQILMYYKWDPDDLKLFGFSKWKPSNYIYTSNSMTATPEKIKRTTQPNLISYNSYGKYVIRLYHCGQWRLIVVDDRIPVSFTGKILLPSIYSNGYLVLWPILLTKALLKLNYPRISDPEFYLDQKHTPQCQMYDGGCCCDCKTVIPVNPIYLRNELKMSRLDPLFALTGWFATDMDFSNKFESDVWNSFKNSLNPYDQQTSFINLKKNEINKNLTVLEIQAPIKELNFYGRESIVRDILCLSYREKSLFKSPENDNDIEEWKKIRWIYWAMEKDIWHPYDPRDYRFIYAYIPPSKLLMYKEILDKDWFQSILGKIQGMFDDASITSILSKNISNKSLSRRRSRSRSGAGKKIALKDVISDEDDEIEEEILSWLDYKKIVKLIQNLRVYNKPKVFSQMLRISDGDTTLERGTVFKGKSLSRLKLDKSKEKWSQLALNETIINELNTERDEEIFFLADFDDSINAYINLTYVPDFVTKGSTKVNYIRWDSTDPPNLYFRIQTIHSKSACLVLPQGRNMFSISVNDCNKYFLLMNVKNGRIRYGNFFEILDRMTTNCQRVKTYFNLLNAAFFNMIEAYGDLENEIVFIKMKRNFFQTILYKCNPDYTQEKTFRNFLYDKFVDKLINHISNYSKEDAYTLKRLFLPFDYSKTLKDPKIYRFRNWKEEIKNYNKIKNEICNCPCNEQGYYAPITKLEKMRITNNAAALIQAYFKGYFIRKISQKRKFVSFFRTELLKLYSKYFDTFQNIIFEFLYIYLQDSFDDFPYNELINIPITPDKVVGNFYEFFKDLKNFITLLTFNGTIQYNRNIKSAELIPFKIGHFSYPDLQCPRKYLFKLKYDLNDDYQILVKIINNDTCCENIGIKDLYCLEENILGYTILIYGDIKNDHNNELNIDWELYVACQKFHRTLSFFEYNKFENDNILRTINEFKFNGKLIDSIQSNFCKLKIYVNCKYIFIFPIFKFIKKNNNNNLIFRIDIYDDKTLQNILKHDINFNEINWIKLKSGTYTFVMSYRYKEKTLLFKCDDVSLYLDEEDNVHSDDISSEEENGEEMQTIKNLLGLWTLIIGYDPKDNIRIELWTENQDMGEEISEDISVETI